jgi:hypothetical protein
MFKMCAQQEGLTQGGIMQAGLPKMSPLQQGFCTISGSQVSQIEHRVTRIGSAQVRPAQVGTMEVGTAQLTPR